MSQVKTLRCAVYTRKSSEEGLDQAFNSLDAQREACEAYVKSQAGEGWELLGTAYDDGGFSGATMERPGLRRLLRHIERGDIDIVVVYKVDRLTRSLADFARIIERFETHSVSFVSVTQAFNTTTSMGRLTLNVLLSFAQFEREVIGERIRDKVAASKKKGIWMGGVPPLGYDMQDRKLAVNPAEAKRVRFIYKRYLQLGSVPELVRDLKAQKIYTKTWRTQKVIERNGVSFGRGALYVLLRNPVYLGQITHKGKTYRSTHELIMSRELWDQVQNLLASHRRKRSQALSRKPGNLLAGILFDDRDNPMASSHATKGGRRYRYYVSRPLLQRDPDTAGSIPRVPAHAIEDLVSSHTKGLLSTASRKSWKKMSSGDRAKFLREVIQRVELRAREVEITLWIEALNPHAVQTRQSIPDGTQISQRGNTLILRLPIRLKTWGGEKLIHSPVGGSLNNGGRLDKTLIKAVARAFAWREKLECGEAESISDLVRKTGLSEDYVRRILKLGFLSPDIVGAILQGKQPPGVTLSHILQANLPLSWRAQREILGFSPAPTA